MQKRLPPLNWLRSFEASARHLNFTQAAVELNLTQAAISQQVKGLESQLGVQLFKRLARGLELTDAGLAYRPAVHEAIDRLAVATSEIFGRGTQRPLTIRVNLVFFTTWLAPRLERFRKEYPDVILNFSSNIWVDEANKDSDMEIRYGKGVWRGFHSDRLTWDELIPVCSATLSDGRLPPTSPSELADHTILHVLGYEEGWGHWLTKTGFTDVEIKDSIKFDTLIAALEVAKSGMGFALGRTSLVKDMITDGTLVAPFEQSLATSEAFYLVSALNEYSHPHAELFRAWLVSEALGAQDPSPAFSSWSSDGTLAASV